MKITILTQYYPPETGAPQNRLSDLAKRLKTRGHDVQVLTALPNYPDPAVFEAYRGKENNTEILDGIKIHRVGIYVPNEKTFWKRIFHYLSFAWNARLHGLRLVQSADILLLESPPLFTALAGVSLAKKLNAKLVTNISDLWPQSAVEMGMLSNGPARGAAYKLEAWLYRNSDLITGQTDGIVENISKRFPDKKVLLYPNGVDAEPYQQLPDAKPVRRQYGWPEDAFVAGYAGILGHAQKLDQILDAAKQLADLPKVHIAFFGDGPCRTHLEARIQKENIRSAKVYGRVGAKEIIPVYAAWNAGIVPLGKEKIFYGARPSKMFEMMAAGLPILLCAQGEAAKVVQGAPDGGAGLIAPPEEPAALAQHIRRLVSEPETGKAMGRRGRAYVFQSFNREAIAKNLERSLLELIHGR
jgi:glycosyltransferase involved in cell wall biosynthesis